MEWIPITEQPMPKDGKNIMVTIGYENGHTDSIFWGNVEDSWLYWDTGEMVSERILPTITAWMYYPEPYKG